MANPSNGAEAKGCEVLNVSQMMRADAFAMSASVPGVDLMEAAGKAVADAARARWARRPVVVLAGPGNNGGDGFVAARHLAADGWPVRVALLGERAALRGDAAHHAALWGGEVVPLSPAALQDDDLAIDALFGAGLTRPLDGTVAAVVAALRERALPCLAVDLPSGLSGDSGAPLGEMFVRADATVTFFRKKPAHLLWPGRGLCGDVTVADIGIPAEALAALAPQTFENLPGLWRGLYPWPGPTDHKYSRGHLLVCGGAAMTGAARLAVRAGQRAGAGMVSLACPPEATAIYAADLLSAIVSPVADLAGFIRLLETRKLAAVVVGPGNGIGEATRAHTLAALAAGLPCVIDADALMTFAQSRPQGPGELFAALAESSGACVLTPHEGEFGRLFRGMDADADKLTRARAAAARAGAVVVLKGYDTVVAAPDGRAAINANAPPALATAGAGDVLAGLAGGLLAQKMPAFEAACAAVWLQGAAADGFGPGLIADDLPEQIPHILRGLRGN
ncbi:MAG TPA: NAD(P)H-hydrate dehydratase [Alphaproteobacteria bacterium]